MAYPRKRENVDHEKLKYEISKETLEKYQGKSFDEVLALMANSDTEKILMATSLLTQIKTSADPSSIKILLAALERQGFSAEKELPISDERYYEIIKTFSRLSVS